jgi:hypothetical protein
LLKKWTYHNLSPPSIVQSTLLILHSPQASAKLMIDVARTAPERFQMVSKTLIAPLLQMLAHQHSKVCHYVVNTPSCLFLHKFIFENHYHNQEKLPVIIC